MISVIVPIYNASAHIETCVNSILNQTYGDFELILINDGSVDNTDEICKIIANRDKRITYLSKKNTGVGSTRNKGIEMAKGEWIVFVDSDDTLASDYLSAFDVEHTTADLVITGIDFFDVKRKSSIRKIEFENKLYSGEEYIQNLKKFFLVGFPVGKAYKKKLLDDNNIKFPTDISFHEDHVFVLDYLLHINSIETKSPITYFYNIDYSVDSLSKKTHPWEKLYKSSNYLFDCIYKFKKKYTLSTDDISEALTFCYESMIGAIYSLYEDNNIKAKEKCSILKNILYGNYSIDNNYYPLDRNGKLIKSLSKILPIWGMHIFFKVVNVYQHRNK